MKKLQLILISIFFSSLLYAENPELKAMFEEWTRQAAAYQGENEDLSIPSKRAIVLGKPELAERPYLTSYNNEVGRKQFGAESLYQIFLVYIEPTKRLNRFTLRGKKKVNAQWLMFCLVHNIEKIQRYG